MRDCLADGSVQVQCWGLGAVLRHPRFSLARFLALLVSMCSELGYFHLSCSCASSLCQRCTFAWVLPNGFFVRHLCSPSSILVSLVQDLVRLSCTMVVGEWCWVFAVVVDLYMTT